MTEQPRHEHPTATRSNIEAVTVGAVRPLNGPIHLADYSDTWPTLFAREATRIAAALGDIAIRIEHVGSTSVPGLAAKPIIDIVLEVPSSSDETTYVPPLEAAGYVLRIRETDWYAHRMFKGPDTDVNLHVFSAGCEEVGRMLKFRDHLRTSSADRQLYEESKRELAGQTWAFVQNYADAKGQIVAEIQARAGAG
jgi:GrpB-like predicted nucleotidyltransferase (UPF0157 family)